MKRAVSGLVFMFFCLAACATCPARAETLSPNSPLITGPTVFSGEKKLACDVKLCLTVPRADAPQACAEPLHKYFSLPPDKQTQLLAKCPMVE